MAFPQVAAVNGGNDVANQINHTVNLPPGIVAGDLLLVIFASDGSATIGFPVGWTQLFEDAYGLTFHCEVSYRVADGTEGPTINVTTSNTQMTAHTSYRIIGFSGVPEAPYRSEGTDAAPDPPSLTPTWGAKDTLWIACCAHDIGTTTVNSYPVNYTDGRNDRSNNTEGVGIGSARRELNVIAEDPGIFTLSDARNWLGETIAIQPTAAGWTGKVSGVTNPAKVMGVSAANIAKVKGVA